MFKHQLFERLNNVQCLNIDNQHIYVSGEDRVQSVTYKIQKALGTKGLDEWRARIGDSEADQIMVQAQIRGKAVHTIAEQYVMNNPDWKKDVMPFNLASFLPIKDFLDKNIETVYATELPMVSRTLRCGGTTDLVCSWNGTNAIVDFKTSLRPKKKIPQYLLQTTTYSLMVEENYHLVCPLVVVIIAVDHEEPQIWVEPRINHVKQVLEIFRA